MIHHLFQLVNAKYDILLTMFHGFNHPECLFDKTYTSTLPRFVPCSTERNNKRTPFLFILALLKDTSYFQKQTRRKIMNILFRYWSMHWNNFSIDLYIWAGRKQWILKGKKENVETSTSIDHLVVVEALPEAGMWRLTIAPHTASPRHKRIMLI